MGSITVAGATLFLGGGPGVRPSRRAGIGLPSSLTSLEFGEKLLGTTSRDVIQVLPTGPTGHSPNVAFLPFLPDFFVRNHCVGRIDMEGCTVIVRFVPQSLGLLETELLITYNGPDSPLRIRLSGIGMGGPEIVLDPDHVTLSGVVIGMKARVAIDVASSGNADLHVLNASTDVSGFHVDASACKRDRVPPGKSCSITVIFAPTARGRVLGALMIDHDASNSPALVQLSGLGVTDKPDLVVRNAVVGETFAAEGSISVPITVSVANDADLPAGTFTVGAESTLPSADDFTQTPFGVLPTRGCR